MNPICVWLLSTAMESGFTDKIANANKFRSKTDRKPVLPLVLMIAHEAVGKSASILALDVGRPLCAGWLHTYGPHRAERAVPKYGMEGRPVALVSCCLLLLLLLACGSAAKPSWDYFKVR